MKDKVSENNWTYKTLSDLTGKCGIFCDGDWIESKDQDKNGTIRLIQLSDIGDGIFRDKSERYLTEDKAMELNCTFLHEGDVLIARMPDPLGRCCLFPLKGENKFVTAVDVCVVRVDKEIVDNRFLCYIINSPQIRNSIHELESGTTRKRISRKNLNTISIPSPPLTEQQLIVEKIEELFSELDAGRSQLETVKKQLETYRQSVLKFAFEGKFTKTKFVESITGDIVDIINNGYTPSREFLSEDFGDIPFIKVYNLNFNGTLNFKKNPTFIPKDIHKNQLKRSICLPGDVLINIVGPPLGKVSIVTDQFPEWNINQAVVMFRPNEKVHSKYLSYFLQNSATINWLEETSKATAGQWNVKVSTCREIPIPICSPEEQEIVVNEIESRLSFCDKLEETIETCLQQSEALKQSILKQAFEGKLIKSPINCK